MRLAVILALVLPACGGSSAESEGSPAIEVRQAFPSEIGDRAGLTIHDEPIQVLVRAGLRTEVRVRVLVHELLHAVGIPDHLPDESCYLHETAYPDLPPTLCPEEAARFLAAVGNDATWDVSLLAENLSADVAQAVAFLNQQAGRAVFLTRP